MKFLKAVFSACLLLIIAPTMVYSNSDDDLDKDESLQLQMAIMSDTHIGSSTSDLHLRSVLADYLEIAPELDVLSIVGDLTDFGRDFEYDLLNEIIRQEINPEVEKVMAMGNHEFFEQRLWPELNLTTTQMKDRFIEKMQEHEEIENVYYDKWIKDYHFIVLGSEEVHPSNWDLPVITEEQYEWLEETIQEDADEQKPIFVFLHQPIDDTISCSEEWGAGFEDDRLKEILQQYPQTFLFSGHTHCLTEHPRTIYQNGFTMIGTGSIAKNRYAEEGLIPVRKSDGLLVDVYEDRVEIKGRDFDNKKWTLSHTVKLPYDKSEEIIDEEAPIFKKGAKFTVERLTGASVELKWDAAVDNTQVDKYMIKQNGQALKTVYVDFWNENSNERLKTEVTDIVYNKDYDFEILAVDAWGNESNTLKSKLLGSVETGWVTINSIWYYINPETVEITNGWLLINEEWYYFNNDGSMRIGWLTEGSVSYYLDANGKIAKGWLKINDEWYHLSDKTGVMTTGWLTEKNKKYYLNTDGKMATGWSDIENNWYFMGSSGVVVTDWFSQNGKWYYLDTTGIMMTGWVTIDSSRYYLDNQGVMATGWLKLDNSWYYMKSSGAMSTGWLNIGEKWYYLADTGVMVDGWTTIDGQWYYMDTAGVIATGWSLVNDQWYYMEASGKMATGWLLINNQWYYMKSWGAMSTDWQLIDGSWYYLKQNGSMQTGWLNIDGKWYYLSAGGKMAKGWITDQGRSYQLGTDGVLIE